MIGLNANVGVIVIDVIIISLCIAVDSVLLCKKYYSMGNEKKIILIPCCNLNTFAATAAAIVVYGVGRLPHTMSPKIHTHTRLSPLYSRSEHSCSHTRVQTE